jgi:LPXTG-site transpeptidase (sortase) family protein
VSEIRARRQRAAWRRRALSSIAVVAGATTIVAGVLAVHQYVFAPDPVLDIERAIGDAPAVTVLTDAANADRQPPNWITVDDIELWSPVRSVGIEETGELEVPGKAEIGWYKYGSAPGLPGATVLAAHVTWNREIGPFFMLGRLEPGALIEVGLHDETVRTYQVVERVMYRKDELPRERIWTTTGDETLVLITCGGSYNSNIRRYRDNIVVYAVPVGVTRPTNLI